MFNSIRKHKHRIAVQLDVFLSKDDDLYVAYCPALDLSSYGKTKKDVNKALEEVVEIFFEETQRKGTLEKVLLKLGWTLNTLPNPLFQPPKLSTHIMQKLLREGSRVNSTKFSIPALH